MSNLRFYKSIKKASFVFLCFLSPSLFAAPPAVKVVIPDHIEGATTLTSESLIEIYQSTSDFILIDSRITEDRNMGHIEDSISLPDINTSCNSLSFVIKHKSSPVGFYCNGPKCGRSVKATRIALQCGYSKVHWFRGGFEEWKSKDYPYLLD